MYSQLYSISGNVVRSLTLLCVEAALAMGMDWSVE
jgi:hypothetical protein